MKLCTGLFAALLSALVALGGAVAALVVVVVIAVAAPDFAETPAFFWASAIVAALLQGALAFLSARLALKRLYRADLDLSRVQALWVGCTGPVLVTFLLQLGIAAGGRVLLAMVPVCAALVGGALGVRASSHETSHQGTSSVPSPSRGGV